MTATSNDEISAARRAGRLLEEETSLNDRARADVHHRLLTLEWFIDKASRSDDVPALTAPAHSLSGIV